jgi:hypothetical protein
MGLAGLLQHLADDQAVRLLVLGAEVDLVLVLRLAGEQAGRGAAPALGHGRDGIAPVEDQL